ncbi:MAG: TonB-dependent receptor [Clostridium sp.]|nr:TonB-dependent receptor [Bacteroides sp.]MCM1198766.1 TonB-dependent receptor [Clostridium sp.]
MKPGTDTLQVAIVASARNSPVSSSTPLRRMPLSGIIRSGARSLDEVVKTFAGISVKDYGGIGGLKTVSIRNLGSQHTAVCYDGIAISDAQNGQVDIGRFNLDNVGSVSVSIGGAEDIFRPARHFTSAGILEIHSLKPQFEQGHVEVSARMTAGSFGTYSPYIRYSQRICKGWSMTASANYLYSRGEYPFVLHNGTLTTDEIRLNSDVNSLNTEINICGQAGDNGSFSAKALYTDCERGLPGSVILYSQNLTERLWDRNLTANARYTGQWKGQWKLAAALGYVRAYSRYVNTDAAYQVPEDDRYVQQEYSVSIIAQYSPVKCLKLVLAEDFFVNYLDTNLPECPFPVRFTSMTALSAQYSLRRLTATAGLVGTYSHETVSRGIPAPDRIRFSPLVSISYRLLKKEELRIRASFKDGYRMPTFNDLYYAKVGNTSLSPEKALMTNLGITWEHHLRKGSYEMTADVYYNKVRDKIVAIPTMFIWKMRNVGQVQMAGADLAASVSYMLTTWLSLDAGAGYSYQYAVDTTDPQAKNYGHQIPYTPRHSGSVRLCLETPWVNVGYTASLAGERYTLAQNIPMNLIEPYADHCISVNHTFEMGRRHIYRLYVGTEGLNLANQNYEIIRYYPMPGISWRVTLKLDI